MTGKPNSKLHSLSSSLLKIRHKIGCICTVNELFLRKNINHKVTVDRYTSDGKLRESHLHFADCKLAGTSLNNKLANH